MARIKPINEAWKDCPRADECCVGACPLVKGKFVSLSCDSEESRKRCEEVSEDRLTLISRPELNREDLLGY